jgi:hypothetical protein
MDRDPSLDTLLDLDGQTFVIDERGGFSVRFVVRRVPADESRPHGLAYSLTLHGPNGERLVEYDNAHPPPRRKVSGRKAESRHDHRHRVRTISPYQYKDAGILLADFWSDVDEMLRQLGVEP